MKLIQRFVALSFFTLGFVASVVAQITLTGTSYTQNFNQLASGLPTGWTVSTGATASGMGNSASFGTAAVAWDSSRDVGGVFRNTSSDNIVHGSSAAAQSANTDRALGWRPGLAAERNGAITVTFADTLGLTGFSVSLDVFTFNDVTAVATYAFEYRVGGSGAFTQLGTTYTTGTPFGAVTYTFSGSALATVANQSQPVSFRLRGTTSSGTGSLDGVAIDNFSLGYSVIAAPVPEPAAAGALAGLGVLLVCGAGRRRRAAQATTKR